MTYACFDTAPCADKVALPLTLQQVERAKQAGFSIRVGHKLPYREPMCEQEFLGWFDLPD